MVNWQVWVCPGEGGMDVDVKWQPGWTTAVKIESGGRYPLGLNRKVVTNEAESLTCNFSIMQSNALGAFGLYYIGTSYTLGLMP